MKNLCAYSLSRTLGILLAASSTALGASAVFGCSASTPEDSDVVVTEVPIRNGVVVRPFAPNTTVPTEAKTVVKVNGGCTGTLIAPSWVLTAAHCGVAAGHIVESIRDTQTVRATIDRTVYHWAADVEMLHLDQPITDLPQIGLIDYAPININDRTVTCYGYGAKATTTRCSSNSECGSDESCVNGWCLVPSADLRSANITARYTNDIVYDTPINSLGQMTLPGDSGGPCFEGGKLAGVASCWNADLSGGVHVNTAYVRDWIAQVMASNYDFDGNPDIVWRNTTSQTVEQVVLWYQKNTTLMGGAPILPSSGEPGWTVRGTADFNGDGSKDILWHNAQTLQVVVWYLNGTRYLSSSQTASRPPDSQWIIGGAADFDKDGTPDIVWYNTLTRQVAVWYLNRDLSQKGDTAVIGGTVDSPNWTIAGVGDLDSDSKPDLVWYNTVSRQVCFWLLDGLAITGNPYLSAIPDKEGWSIRGIGDFNRDNFLDLFWYNVDSRELAVWYLQSSSIVGYDFILSPHDTSGWSPESIITN